MTMTTKEELEAHGFHMESDEESRLNLDEDETTLTGEKNDEEDEEDGEEINE